MTQFSRRKFLFTAGAATAGTILIHGCSTGPVNTSKTTTTAVAQSANAPKVETTAAKLGFIALTDSAPLIIAKEKGFFDKYGMKDVEVSKQASWPVTRDNLELGSSGGGIDGAHILTPMPYLMTMGKITKQPVPMYLLARLNTNGQAISVSNAYKDLKVGLDSKPMVQAIAKAKS
ncbi:MAG TPA: CmpA/NrtA family ABC transporter substrate-binding protein, partial [Candidatus Sericytochromatia bacterium]